MSLEDLARQVLIDYREAVPEVFSIPPDAPPPQPQPESSVSTETPQESASPTAVAQQAAPVLSTETVLPAALSPPEAHAPDQTPLTMDSPPSSPAMETSLQERIQDLPQESGSAPVCSDDAVLTDPLIEAASAPEALAQPASLDPSTIETIEQPNSSAPPTTDDLAETSVPPSPEPPAFDADFAADGLSEKAAIEPEGANTESQEKGDLETPSLSTPPIIEESSSSTTSAAAAEASVALAADQGALPSETAPQETAVHTSTDLEPAESATAVEPDDSVVVEAAASDEESQEPPAHEANPLTAEEPTASAASAFDETPFDQNESSAIEDQTSTVDRSDAALSPVGNFEEERNGESETASAVADVEPPQELMESSEVAAPDAEVASEETPFEAPPEEPSVAPPGEKSGAAASSAAEELLPQQSSDVLEEELPPPADAQGDAISHSAASEKDEVQSAGEPLKKDLIEQLLREEAAAESETSPEVGGESTATAVGPSDATSAQEGSLTNSETDLIAGLFNSPPVDAPEPVAVAPLTPPPGPKPKIDFAALRRARNADVGQANVKVGRLFGGGTEEAALFPIAPDASTPKAPPPPPTAKLAPPDPMKAIRAVGRLPAKLEEWSDQLQTLDPKLFYSIGMLGVLFGINGVAIVVLAFLGWI